MNWEDGQVGKVPATEAQGSEFRARSTHLKNQAWLCMLVILMLGKQKWAGPWSSLASQHSQTSELQVQ